MKVLPIEHLTYNTGPRGSLRLRCAAASFLNEEFHPREMVTAANMFITPGLASAIDALSWAICNEGEGIMVPQPFYNGFLVDTLNRSNARLVGVTYDGVEGYKDLDDLFCPAVNRKAIEAAFRKAQEEGITPPETLKGFASFCGKEGLHFISDEIYAKSLFPNPAIPNPTPFISALALDLDNVIDPTFVHVLYGASKDFCANGLRLGFVCTKNEGVVGAMSSIGIFSWSPHVIQDVWAAMLEDKQWMRSFMLKKSKLMAENYDIARTFFRNRGIGYYEMNAGLYLWVDLRHLLIPKETLEESGYSALRVNSPEAGIYKQREMKVAEICMKNGVMIAPGNVYMPEELGWFRITFSLGKEALEEGLKRLEKSLVEAKAEIQG
ncbi:hypothetical protein PHISCL_08362 [Aspergillus sclerotialis]|uniref:Aminotransferase class I/classII large domain-containing protein n=1 Tax=Aspergillus sclerotialis TaxID=2070753 RepID=A0A3A2ZN60_9EURO|nr:hypothetical protein PHISCL_08362 [Aspergillus sclerotialis]